MNGRCSGQRSEDLFQQRRFSARQVSRGSVGRVCWKRVFLAMLTGNTLFTRAIGALGPFSVFNLGISQISRQISCFHSLNIESKCVLINAAHYWQPKLPPNQTRSRAL